MELNPADAESHGVTDGEPVEIEADASDAQVLGVTVRCVARVTDRTPRGIAYLYFNYGGDPATAANNTVSTEPDPINGMYSFKLGRGTLRRID